MSSIELDKFARWFHQDFALTFENLNTGVDAYLDQISSKSKYNLSCELDSLLVEFPGKDSNGLKEAWIRLGAQWWDKDKVPIILAELAKTISHSSRTNNRQLDSLTP
jgi:hypothetical protein